LRHGGLMFLIVRPRIRSRRVKIDRRGLSPERRPVCQQKVPRFRSGGNQGHRGRIDRLS
jgi:hypothetical protein